MPQPPTMVQGIPAVGEDPNRRITRFLDRLSRRRYYGDVLLTFQSGRVCAVKLHEVLKPDELPVD